MKAIIPKQMARPKIKFAYVTGKFRHKNPIILRMSEAPCIINTDCGIGIPL
jgi:hypothetical protein|tara:strand:+ start:736 stop:888 length:153 start_codon:yes stop_codon:yes gene_type:complete